MEKLKALKELWWAIGIIFIAGSTYASMSGDVARATEEYKRNSAAIEDMQRDFRQYRRSQRREFRNLRSGQNEIRLLLEGLRNRAPARQ